MKPILPAVLLLALGCSAPMNSAASEKESAVDSMTLMVHEQAVQLGDKPVTVPVSMAEARPRNPGRKLVLHVEGISVTQQPGIVYEVLVNDVPVGVLSFYGAEEGKGAFSAGFAIDQAVKDAKELRVTFKPRGVTGPDGRETIELTGRARFSRLRLAEE